MKKFTLMAAVALLAGSALMTGCQKDFDGVLRLAVENFDNGDTKLAVNGTHSTWANGDEIRINDGAYPVAVNGSNEASISGVPGASNFYAVYPASLCSSASASVTLNLPATYQYHSNGTKQLLELPMVGYLDPNSDHPYLMLNHVTGAIVVRVFNLSDAPMSLDTVAIISNDYKLSGSRTVDVANPSSSALTTSNDAEKKVTILFDQEKPIIAVNDYLDVMVPIPPVESANRFTVYVASHTRKKRFSHTRTSNKNGNLARNQVGYAEVNMRSSNQFVFTYDPLSKDGSGNYLIKNPEDYMFIVEACNEGWRDGSGVSYANANYVINNNINMSGYVVEPIYSFNGSINGGNNEIQHLTIESDYTTNGSGRVAMIATTAHAKCVYNLTLRNVSVTYTGSSSAYMAGFIAYDASASSGIANQYENLYIYGLTAYCSTSSDTKYIGGIIGAAVTNAKGFSSCEAHDVIWGAGGATQTPGGVFVGGLVSRGAIALAFDGCGYSSTQPLSFWASMSRWGGLVGEQTGDVTATFCDIESNVALIRSNTVYAGGLIGRAASALNVNAEGTTISGTIFARGGSYQTDCICGNSSNATVTTAPDDCTLSITTY